MYKATYTDIERSFSFELDHYLFVFLFFVCFLFHSVNAVLVSMSHGSFVRYVKVLHVKKYDHFCFKLVPLQKKHTMYVQ